MPRFKSIIFFIKIALKLSYFSKTMQNFRALGTPPPHPQNSSPLRISGYAPSYDRQLQPHIFKNKKLQLNTVKNKKLQLSTVKNEKL